MNDRENRRYQMFVRARDFGIAHKTDFASASLGLQLFTRLSDIVTTLDTHAGSQASSVGSAKQGTTSREQARQNLRDDLEAISRTARAMADDVVGLNDKFRMPPQGNDQNLLSSARALPSMLPHCLRNSLRTSYQPVFSTTSNLILPPWKQQSAIR